MASKVLLFGHLRPVFFGKKSFSTSAVKNAAAPPGSPPYRLDVPPMTYGPRVKFVHTIQTLIWFNIFYSFWYQPELALGHPQFQPPKPELWTDEELGIPPDDYDEVVEQGNAYYIRSS